MVALSIKLKGTAVCPVHGGFYYIMDDTGIHEGLATLTTDTVIEPGGARNLGLNPMTAQYAPLPECGVIVGLRGFAQVPL